jgi:hypothetical protein
MASDWEKPVNFAGRDVPRYAVHVASTELAVGEVYFRLLYLDEQMLVPELVPLVFVGRDLDGVSSDAAAQCFFQDAASYIAGVRWADAPAPLDGSSEEERLEQMLARGHFESFLEEQVSVMSFENALDLLLLCSLRREGKAP